MSAHLGREHHGRQQYGLQSIDHIHGLASQSQRRTVR